MKKFDLIIFDWEGTLGDVRLGIAHIVEKIIEDLHLPTLDEKFINKSISQDIVHTVEHLFPEQGSTMHQKIIERYQYYLGHRFVQADIFCGVKETLQNLYDQGYFLAIATGKSEEGLKRTLEETGLNTLIHASRAAGQVPVKPDPQMIIELLDELQVSPRRSVMVGDTKYDMQLAKNAHIASIGVSYGLDDVKCLQKYQPLVILEDIRELPSWLT